MVRIMKTALAALSFLLTTNLATAQLNCTVVSCGESCGPTLTVTFTPHPGGAQRVNLTANGLHQNALTGLYWGDNETSVPLPGGCMLLITPIWGTFHTSSASGSFSWERTWPHWAQGQFYMQMGSLEILQNGGYNALTTNCKIGGCF